jgi:peptidoglycan/LPS O-acetylase OafA/YrhL
MRKVTLILGLLIVLVLLLQSCASAGISSHSPSISEDDPRAASAVAGGVGLAAALYGIIGLSFVLTVPLVSVMAFALAALIAALGPTLGFGDGKGWAVALGMLSVFALIGHLGLRRKKRLKKAQNNGPAAM